MPRRELTDEQMVTFVHSVAHIYMEVERGLRDPQHLQRLMTRAEFERHRQLPPDERLRPRAAGPVRPGDIGKIRIDRTHPREITAAIPTRESGERWGSLVIDLRQVGDGWLVTRLERLQRRGLEPTQEGVAEPGRSLDDRVRQVKTELRLVHSAQRATEAQLDEAVDEATRQELEGQARRWEAKAEELGAELAELERNRQLSEKREPIATSGAAARAAVPALGRILGPRPRTGADRTLWDAIREQVESYRDRWGLPDEGTLLGGDVSGTQQQAHRERVADLIKAARRILESSRDPEPRRGRTIEIERELGRDL